MCPSPRCAGARACVCPHVRTERNVRLSGRVGSSHPRSHAADPQPAPPPPHHGHSPANRASYAAAITGLVFLRLGNHRWHSCQGTRFSSVWGPQCPLLEVMLSYCMRRKTGDEGGAFMRKAAGLAEVCRGWPADQASTHQGMGELLFGTH